MTHDLARAAADGCRIIGLAKGALVVDAAAEVALSPDMLSSIFGCEFEPLAYPATRVKKKLNVVAQKAEPVSEAPARLRNPWIWFAVSLAVVVVVFLVVTFLAGLIGNPVMSPLEIIGNPRGDEAHLFFDWRMPRCVTAFLVGAALSLAGLVFQAMFRNPLATPYTLGVSGGASFGAVVALQFGVAGSVLGHAAVQSSAFMGALLSVAIVYGTFRLKRRASVTTMLLAGVGCSFLFSSLIMLLQYVCDPAKTIQTLYWMMGGIFVTGFGDALQLVPALVIGVGATVFLAKELDVMLLGDEISASRGVNIDKVRNILFLAVSLMTAAVVSLCSRSGLSA